MNKPPKKARNLRQVLLLMVAQALAIASMIWGGSLTVDTQQTPILTTQPSQQMHYQAGANNNKTARVKLLDFSIGRPWS